MARMELSVVGTVQGIGFRPFVYRLAQSYGFSGWVCNHSQGVRVQVQGRDEALRDFAEKLRSEAPPNANILSIACEWLTETDEQGFRIVPSTPAAGVAPSLPADLATCTDCLRELESVAERRHSYPFTNCAHCGPRYSIVHRLPYDRKTTTMHAFVMCTHCQSEYADPGDRRFHAQPIACPNCGPKLRLLDASGSEQSREHAALQAAMQAICQGRILALKGLGGFQLIVDARNEAAVGELRRRKQRERKPFAVMFPNLLSVEALCELEPGVAELLSSASAPIVLLRARPDTSPRLAPSVAPAQPSLGVFLPYTPLHHLLLSGLSHPVVCTSGNLSEEPMAITNEQALTQLAGIADLFLVHDRPIARPVDDSVFQINLGTPQVLRRARGYAPLPMALPQRKPALESRLPSVLALGAHLKSTVSLVVSGQLIASQHLGDLSRLASVELLQRTVNDLLSFFEVTPDAIACDLHPEYASTIVAKELSQSLRKPLFQIQHHHAHIAASIAEHQLDGPVLGFAWDGTGYGSDGTLWGSECLLCSGSSFQRLSHISPFRLPGGDRAAREPRRSALGLLNALDSALLVDPALPVDPAQLVDPALLERRAKALFSSQELHILTQALERHFNCPTTSSMGRLFDGVAALVLGTPFAAFEAEAAMQLEFAATSDDAAVASEAYPLSLSRTLPWQLELPPLLRAMLSDVDRQLPKEQIALKFHLTLANYACEVAERCRAELSAGVPTGSATTRAGACHNEQMDPAQPGAGARAEASGLQFGGGNGERGTQGLRASAGEPLTVVLSGGCFQNRLLTRLVSERLERAGHRVFIPRRFPPNDGGISVGQAFLTARRLTAPGHE